ncbi:hypothetical protein DP57_2410 [Burkholderia pseudomallei]|uniref:SOS response-associated peptidase family protein n=1 Tax=Burkholderia pseudomallei TaxID=28450 RepID=UPI00050F99D4|nr:SOS response-associated peptidase family protein [Burkholderia pseudomallei]KGC66883.1 hypothetical protein DP57_2410 [Burkholderia pseudomallei]
MCTNYRAPDEDPGISELRLGLIDLWKRAPWEPEIWPDYAAPIVRAASDGAEAVIANFGMIPKVHQPPGKKYLTVNARAETAQWIYEPNWETGKHVRYRIGLMGWQPLCVAGIWRAWKGADGGEILAMAMLTVNADEHPVMKHMHKPGDEKRSVVILRPADYDEWLHTKNIEAACAMLQLYPADELVAVTAPKSAKSES